MADRAETEGKDIAEFDWKTAKKPELRVALKTALEELKILRDSVGRLLRQSPAPTVTSHTSREDDSVPAGWAERHGVTIPRADGIFESATAWLRIKHGVIVGAGLKNQSILLLAISLELLDQGAEHHGGLYKDWKSAFLSRLDPTKSGEAGSDNPDAWSKEDRYCKLLRRVEPDYLAAMDCIVSAHPRAKHLAAFQGNQAQFIEAFNLVARTMNEINRDAEAARDAVA